MPEDKQLTKARNDSVKKRRGMTTEKGVKGEISVDSFRDWENRVDYLNILDYRRMVDNDGTIQMIWNAIVNTILSAGFEIIDDPELDQEEESEELQFVKSVLLNPRWKGGMSSNIHQINRDKLRAFIEGYRVYEVIYRLDGGKYLLNKLAPRAIKRSEGEIKLIVDDVGEFVGYYQNTSFKGKAIEIEVRNASDIHKAHLVNYGAEFGSNYGRSGLKGTWYHYDKAHKGMFLNHVAHELGANKAKFVGKQGALSDDEDSVDDQLMDALQNAWQETTVMYNAASYEIEVVDLADANVMAQGKDMISMHQSQMAQSLLAQFIQLGSEGSNTGSRALGSSQADFFTTGLQTIAEILLEASWNKLIADMVMINFGTDIFPQLKWNSISNRADEQLMEGFLELIRTNQLTDNVVNKLTIKGTDALGIEVSEEEIEEERKEKMEMEQKQKQAEMDIQAQRFARPQMSEDVELAEVGIIRDLYPDERKVMLGDIERHMTDGVATAERILTNKLNKQKEDVIRDYLGAIRKGRKSIDRVEVKLQEGKYSDELLALALLYTNLGKDMASKEIGELSPTLPTSMRRKVESEVARIIKVQESELEFRLQQVAQDALDTGIAENQASLLMEQEFNKFIDTKTTPTVNALVPRMFNQGRAVAFEKYMDKIFAFRYTAVIDQRTTEYCSNLDGRVFQPNDPDFFMVSPPNHFGCRSIWTPILQTESAGVVVDGKPTGQPVFSSISTFRDVQEITALTDNRIQKLKDKYAT
jgi:SPP1 gp7 family putative phage head morphogenesis protein